MIANNILQSSLVELNSITKTELCILDIDGGVVAGTFSPTAITPVSIRSFIDSSADNQTIMHNHYFKVMDDGEVAFVLITKGEDEYTHTIGRVAVSQIQNLITAYKDRYDVNNFFQNLILDNLLLVDIYNKAKKLSISLEQKRAVFLVEVDSQNDNVAIETLRNMFSNSRGDYVTSVDEKNLILIKGLDEDENYDDLESVAFMLADMMNTEAMVKVRVSYGNIVGELKDVSKSYKEAAMALNVGKIFYNDKMIIPYNMLGIGRLIYQLPISLCKIFMNEIFGENVPDDLDEEILNTINKFFENNLNVSETSRQLYVHRNTLVYRIEKLQKSTGLDIRIFEDALTLKIALMVVNYMKYLEEKGELV